jgi:hypothetical protein
MERFRILRLIEPYLGTMDAGFQTPAADLEFVARSRWRTFRRRPHVHWQDHARSPPCHAFGCEFTHGAPD